MYSYMYPKMCTFYYSEQEVTRGFSSGSTQIYNYRQREGEGRRADKGGGREQRKVQPEPDLYIFLSLSRGNSQN